jgi:LPXTG-site transpeptidase (sortase) family protein
MTKMANWMIFVGILVLAVGAGNAWWQYRINHSVLDVVDTAPQSQSGDFMPPIQAQDGQAAPTVPAPVSLPDSQGGTIDVPPEVELGTPVPTPDTATGYAPDRLVIPSIFVDAPIISVHYKTIEYQDQTLQQWLVPTQLAAGWQDTSALLGVPGNTVLNGHHDAYGKVFQSLIKLVVGDEIRVYSGSHVFEYQVAAKMLLPERFQPLEVRLANARWIMPSDDERLTLITCWPADSNTNRVVIVAFPAKK